MLLHDIQQYKHIVLDFNHIQIQSQYLIDHQQLECHETTCLYPKQLKKIQKKLF